MNGFLAALRPLEDECEAEPLGRAGVEPQSDCPEKRGRITSPHGSRLCVDARPAEKFAAPGLVGTGAATWASLMVKSYKMSGLVWVTYERNQLDVKLTHRRLNGANK